ncbi:putative Bestrophin-2 [Penaeus vannamei]|uniref:Bestrophin homolog n=1 Tax=Penaeus vannamei TaxID=6689 RepID=A0A423SHZ5_PENVA|nr:putative Bestrophin-2 [Penaeus vannamei]
MTHGEKAIFEMMDEQTKHHKIWMPLSWACQLTVRARQEGRVPDDYGQEAIIHEVTNLRYNCGKLQEYHHMSVPLVYTQVVTMATYSYFGFAILGRQFLDTSQGYDKHKIDFYVPIFTLLQFIFYVGWLKVAESLLNPFGDDDDDFDTCDFLDRHFEVSYMIVDVMHKSYPETLNNYWDNSSFQLASVSNAGDHQGYKNNAHSKKSQNSQKNNKQEKLSPVIKSISRLCSDRIVRPSVSRPTIESWAKLTTRQRKMRLQTLVLDQRAIYEYLVISSVLHGVVWNTVTAGPPIPVRRYATHQVSATAQRSRCNQTCSRVNVSVGTQDDLPPPAAPPNDHPLPTSPGALHTTRVYIPAINDHLGAHDATPQNRDLPDPPEDDQEISTLSRSLAHQYTNGGFLAK